MDCVVDPPQPGSPSYDLFIKEKTQVLESLAKRAKMIAETFNSIPGVKCNPVQGAMYAFPKVKDNSEITYTSLQLKNLETPFMKLFCLYFVHLVDDTAT